MISIDGLLHGKNALVTGAGRNIGAAVARELVSHGATLFFTEIDETLVAETKRSLHAAGVDGRGFVSDITNPKANDLLCSTLRNERIVIDLLVNNVGVDGVEQGGGLDGLRPEVIRSLFDTNLFGPLDLTRRIAETMVEKSTEGSILFLSSIHQWTVRTLPAYSASKAATGMIIRELAVELAPHRIRVNGIAPGYVALDRRKRPVRHRYTLLHGTAVDPAHIGRAAVYLSSDYFSKHTTGTVLTIDGGLSLNNHLTGAAGGK